MNKPDPQEVSAGIIDALSGANIDEALDKAKLQRIQLHETKHYNKLSKLAASGWILQQVENELVAKSKIKDMTVLVRYIDSQDRYSLTISSIVHDLAFDSVPDIISFFNEVSIAVLNNSNEFNLENMVSRIKNELL